MVFTVEGQMYFCAIYAASAETQYVVGATSKATKIHTVWMWR